MYSRPWLDVAVKVRAPIELAPRQAHIALCSDSTYMYWLFREPSSTKSLSRSTTMVCGVMG